MVIPGQEEGVGPGPESTHSPYTLLFSWGHLLGSDLATLDSPSWPASHSHKGITGRWEVLSKEGSLIYLSSRVLGLTCLQVVRKRSTFPLLTPKKKPQREGGV